MSRISPERNTDIALACIYGKYTGYHSARYIYWQLPTVPYAPINRTGVINGDTTYQICGRDTEKRINVILEIINVFRKTGATRQTSTKLKLVTTKV